MSYYSFKSIIFFLTKDNALTTFETTEESKAKIVGCLWGRDCLGNSDSLFLSWDKRRISTFFRKMQKCMFTLQLFAVINHLNL